MAGSLPELTLKEKVLLWLVHVQDHGGDDPGLASTQAGISNATGLSRGHVSRTVAPLLEAGLIREEAQRVTGFSRRLKGYRVTASGRAEQERLVARLSPLSIEVRRSGSAPERVLLGEAAASIVARDGWWPVLARLYEQGHLELEGDRASKPMAQWARDLADAPPAGRFVGRSQDVERLRAWIGGPVPLFVVTGPGGRGKTTFVGNAVRAIDPRRHVLWIRMNDWLTLQGFVDRVDRLLSELGRPPTRPAPDDTGGLVDHLGRRMRDFPMLVVVDDCQKAGPALGRAIEALAQVARGSRHVKLVLIGREIVLPPDHLRAAERLALAPLADEAAVRLLTELGVAPDARDAIIEAAQGNPLFLELLSRSGDSAQVRVDFFRFLAEDLAAGLPGGHLAVLRWASAMRVPEDASFWARVGVGSPAALAELGQASLLQTREDGRFDMHDIVRTAFYDQLTFAERKEIHARLARAYDPALGRWDAVAEYLHHLVRAGRRDEAVRWVLRNQSRLIERARQLFEKGTGGNGQPAR